MSPTTVAGGGVAFDPIGGGTTTVAASIPDSSRPPPPSVGVTVSGPGIQLLSLPTTVGAGLQDGYTARLGATQHGGVAMRISSSNPAVALIAPNGDNAWHGIHRRPCRQWPDRCHVFHPGCRRHGGNGRHLGLGLRIH